MALANLLQALEGGKESAMVPAARCLAASVRPV